MGQNKLRFQPKNEGRRPERAIGMQIFVQIFRMSKEVWRGIQRGGIRGAEAPETRARPRRLPWKGYLRDTTMEG
jgi:hypothetical protein